MIMIEKVDVWGFEHAIRGMRNPMNSWERSDTQFYPYDQQNPSIGENDRDLMTRLIRGGQPHRKFLRQIFVSVDITAPLYWWKEFDTYKVGTTANSCSTMHKIHAKEFELEDFSHEHLFDWVEEVDGEQYKYDAVGWLNNTISQLNYARHLYLETKNKDYWWLMIQLLPTSYNQKRTVTMTYENLLNMLEYRRGHKLDEWRQFCDWILTLPYGELLKEGIENESSTAAKSDEKGSPGK
jgi:hypothetical protein